MKAAVRAAWRWLTEHRDALAEWVVLGVVLAIAAFVSYTHLRDVHQVLGTPWPYLGPLSVDGLFAAAWLRMRRRRRQGEPVGALAWVALGVALVATLAGNVAAAFPGWLTEYRDWVAPWVFAWPAVAFALVWELVTGHSRPARQQTASEPPAPAPALESTTASSEDHDEKAARLLAEGAGRPTLKRELGITDHQARQLQRAHKEKAS
ncbi:DUF2637 domain-containing protein [Pseudonocardia pini]|uniref:DUF2637 domain-containing protein n=1 Tax=Pseudonocardia pini TaxID=2758030 RepID=UPI0015F06DA4|nr:DUF2637 domain-containing protein [Pseudonocardia pini]